MQSGLCIQQISPTCRSDTRYLAAPAEQSIKIWANQFMKHNSTANAPAELPAVLVIMDLAEHVRLHIAYHDPCEARAARTRWGDVLHSGQGVSSVYKECGDLGVNARM